MDLVYINPNLRGGLWNLPLNLFTNFKRKKILSIYIYIYKLFHGFFIRTVVFFFFFFKNVDYFLY